MTARRPGTNRHNRNVAGNAVAQAKAIMRGDDDPAHFVFAPSWSTDYRSMVDQRAQRASAFLWAVAEYLTRLEARP